MQLLPVHIRCSINIFKINENTVPFETKDNSRHFKQTAMDTVSGCCSFAFVRNHRKMEIWGKDQTCYETALMRADCKFVYSDLMYSFLRDLLLSQIKAVLLP